MRDKIIKRFLAGAGSVCVLYGSVTTGASMVFNNAIIPPTTISEEYSEAEDNNTGYFDTPPQENGNSDENPVITEQPEEETEEMSLSEFLSTLRCDGCRKGCSLLSPRCTRGRANAQEATTEYYAIYGEA